jgi:neurofibromin 1
VALHRFLYDNWESVKVKLFALERRSWQGTAADPEPEIAANQKPTSLKRLSQLIPSLGTPQIQISWNSPQPSANPPHVFSRFQDFMLRNVRKHGESVASLRAIYDAGLSRVSSETTLSGCEANLGFKDSMPVICIVLRTIEQEELDTDFVLFHFFKVRRSSGARWRTER